jgi:hypothetical protein
MAYRLFFTDFPLPQGQEEPNYKTLIPFGFNTKEEAIEAAYKLIMNKKFVWRIEGDDGMLLNQSEIEEICNPKPKWPKWPEE